MNIIHQRMFAELGQIVGKALSGYDAQVYLFGSWAKGRPSQHSDIDIAVDAGSALPAGVLANLRDCLEESHIPYRVDVVDLSVADGVFREKVQKEGIAWKDLKSVWK